MTHQGGHHHHIRTLRTDCRKQLSEEQQYYFNIEDFTMNGGEHIE